MSIDGNYGNYSNGYFSQRNTSLNNQEELLKALAEMQDTTDTSDVAIDTGTDDDIASESFTYSTDDGNSSDLLAMLNGGLLSGDTNVSAEEGILGTPPEFMPPPPLMTPAETPDYKFTPPSIWTGTNAQPGSLQLKNLDANGLPTKDISLPTENLNDKLLFSNLSSSNVSKVEVEERQTLLPDNTPKSAIITLTNGKKIRLSHPLDEITFKDGTKFTATKDANGVITGYTKGTTGTGTTPSMPTDDDYTFTPSKRKDGSGTLTLNSNNVTANGMPKESLGLNTENIQKGLYFSNLSGANVRADTIRDAVTGKQSTVINFGNGEEIVLSKAVNNFTFKDGLTFTAIKDANGKITGYRRDKVNFPGTGGTGGTNQNPITIILNFILNIIISMRGGSR